MGSSSSSTVTNTISNLTVNTSTLESFNQQTNNFITSNIMKASANCAATSTQSSDNEAGDITVVGKKQKVNLTMDTTQDNKVNLQCIQNTIQQMDISSTMAQSILQNMQQAISNDQMANLVNNAEASLKAGAGGSFLNPFANSSSEINMNLSNTQINETTRKLSNVISNTVANNVEATDIKNCFAKSIQLQSNKVGNLKIIGEENELNLTMSTKQVGQSLATCQQLTEQTSKCTSALATTLGFTIVDDTKNKIETEATTKTKAETSVAGFDAIIGAIFSGLQGIVGVYVAAIAGVIICCCCLCALIFIVPRLGGSNKSEPASEEPATEEPATEEPASEEPASEEPATEATEVANNDKLDSD